MSRFPPGFVTLQQLKERKEKRDEEEKLKREAAAAEAEKRRRAVEQQRRREEEERKRRGGLLRIPPKTPRPDPAHEAAAAAAEKERGHPKIPPPGIHRPKGNYRLREPWGPPLKQHASHESQAATAKGIGEGITRMQLGGANGSEEGSELIGVPARVKVSGGGSWQPGRVTVDDKQVSAVNAVRRTDPSPRVTEADVEERISDLKLGGERDPKPMPQRSNRGRAGGRTPGLGRGTGGRRSGRWSGGGGGGMMWVKKETAA